MSGQDRDARGTILTTKKFWTRCSPDFPQKANQTLEHFPPRIFWFSFLQIRAIKPEYRPSPFTA